MISQTFHDPFNHHVQERKKHQSYKNLTCSGVRVNGLFPMVNVMFGIFGMLSQLIIDSPDGLGRLSQSCWKLNPIHINLNNTFLALEMLGMAYESNSPDPHTQVFFLLFPSVSVDSGPKLQASHKLCIKDCPQLRIPRHFLSQPLA